MLNLKDFEYVVINTDDEHWFDNTGCQYPLVCPKGTRVRFIEAFWNYYGFWFEVEYKGKRKYILPCLCDGNVMIECEVRTWFDTPSCSFKKITFLTDRYGKKYILHEKGELELL